MPLIKKVVDIGNGKAVFLPKTWLKFYEVQFGREIKLVAMEVDRKLEIEPYIPNKKQKTEVLQKSKNAIESLGRGRPNNPTSKASASTNGGTQK